MPGQFLMDNGVDISRDKLKVASDLLREEGIPHVVDSPDGYSISFPGGYQFDIEDAFDNAGIHIDDVGPNDQPHHILSYDGWVRTKE